MERPAGGISPVTTMKCQDVMPAPTLRKIPSSSGRIWSRNACGKLEKVPSSSAPHPLCGPPLPEFRTEEGNGERPQ